MRYLTHRYDFNEDTGYFYDQQGNLHAQEWLGGDVVRVAAEVNRGVYSSASNKGLWIGDNANAYPDPMSSYCRDPFSIAVKFKADTLNGAERAFVSKGAYGYDNLVFSFYILRSDHGTYPGRLAFSAEEGGPTTGVEDQIVSATRVDDNTWHTAVFTRYRGEWKIFIDSGTPNSEKDVIVGCISASEDTTTMLVSRQDDANRTQGFTDGIVSKILFFCNNLSEAEVTRLLVTDCTEVEETPASLIHEYRLEERGASTLLAVDRIAGNHGYPDGGGPGNAAGRFYWGRIWTATTQRLTCGNPTDLQHTTGVFGFRLWFKCTATSTADRYLFAKIAGSQIGYGLRIEASTDGANPNGLTLVTSSDGSAETLITGTTNVCDSEWQCVVIGRSGTSGSIFLNGVSEASGSVPATIHNSTADFVIGNTGVYDVGALNCTLNYLSAFDTTLGSSAAHNLWKHHFLTVPDFAAHEWLFRQFPKLSLGAYPSSDTGYSLDRSHINSSAGGFTTEYGGVLDPNSRILPAHLQAYDRPDMNDELRPITEKFSIIWGGYLPWDDQSDTCILYSFSDLTTNNRKLELYVNGSGDHAIYLALSANGTSWSYYNFHRGIVDVDTRYDYNRQSTYSQIILTRDGTSYKLYWNGYLLKTVAGISALFDSNASFSIGTREGAASLGLKGAVDLVQFYLDRELTETEAYEKYFGPSILIRSRIVVTRENPYHGKRNTLENVNISFSIEDILQTSGVNQSTLSVTFNGISVISGGALQTGYGGSIDTQSSGFGYDVDIDPNNFFGYCQYVFVVVNVEDNEGTAMDTHTWWFRIRCVEVGKSFLLNSGLGSVNSVSSLFKEKISNVTAGSKGNISLNVTAEPVPSTVKDYELRVVRAGRLDKDIDTVQEITKDLGSGQVSYTEARSFRGNFFPPHFVIDENTGTYPVFGYERTLSKFIGGGDSGDRVGYVNLCNRNDDSVFAFVLDGSSTTSSFVYSHAKPGKTDASPLSKVTIGSFRVYSSARITNDTYLLVSVDGWSSSDETLFLKAIIVDDSATKIDTLENFDLAVKDPAATTPTIGSIDIYSDMNGNVYGVVDYISDMTVFGNTEPIFFKSYNNGRNWEIIKEPGTDSYVSIGNPLEETGFNPQDSNNGRGYHGARIYWDEVNEEFILTITGLVYNGTNSLSRCVLLSSKDFRVWNRMSYPILKSNVADTFNSDFNSIIPTTPEGNANLSSRFVRLGDKFFSIGAEYNAQQYTCIFPNEEELYGSRLGYFWSGDNASAPNDGVQIREFDLKKIDDVIYIISSHYTSVNVKGYVVNAIGTLTNLPDQGLYNGAWFGHMSLPSINHGWTRNVTGSPTETLADTGLTITGSLGVFVNYSRAVIAGAGGETVFKLSVKPITDSGPSSVTAQGIRLVLDGTTTQVDFTVRISTAGLYFRDNISTYNYTLAFAISDYIDILIAYRADDVRVYYKTLIEYEDRWELFIERTSLSNSALTESYTFGILSDPGAASSAIWRYIYYRDNYTYGDINADIRLEGNLVSFSSSDYDDELDSIPMNIAEETQQSTDDIVLIWRGMDSFEEDKWNFTVDSDFGATNVFLKSPSVIYRTENTSSDQNFVIDADDDDISSYLFDVFMLLNTNFRYVRVQANDTDTWTSPSYNTQLDFTYDTGTIAADSTRIDDDLLTVRMTGKDYLHGELKDKYVMLEKILEPGTPSDNTYRNVAFKILESGPDYAVISTKGLTANEAGGGGTYQDMKVVSGDDFIIYDTQISDYEGDIQNYRFIRVLIEASDGYGIAWSSTNQPNLPNERSWQIGEFDIGIRAYLTEDVSYPYNEEESINVTSKENDYGQIDFTKHGEPLGKCTLNYKVLSDEDYEQILAIYNTAADSAQPFWYIPNIANHPTRVYLVNLRGPLKSNRSLPDYQTVRMDIEEVK